MRMCLDRMPKKELHGQHPVVTLPTKQALNQFESQQKTRPVPPTQSSNGPPPPSQRSSGPESMSRSSGSASQSSYQQQSHQPRLMSSNNGPSQYRPHMQSQSLQGGQPLSGQAPQRVQQQPLMPHPPMSLHSQQQQGPMRYAQNQSQWNNGPPRPGPNGPPRPGPGMNGPPGPPQHRPMVIRFLDLVLRRLFVVLFCITIINIVKRLGSSNSKYEIRFRNHHILNILSIRQSQFLHLSNICAKCKHIRIYIINPLAFSSRKIVG